MFGARRFQGLCLAMETGWRQNGQVPTPEEKQQLIDCLEHSMTALELYLAQPGE